MSGLLIRGAEVDGHGCVDVRVAGGRITEVGTALARLGEEELAAHGGALLPGLSDSHLHLLALAAALRSVACGPPAVTDRTALARALAGALPAASGWVRGVGYVESVAGDLRATDVDALHAARPVRIQHRSGALWMLNTAAVERLGLASADAPGIERDGRGEPTGRLWRADAELRRWLPPEPPPDLAPVGESLARLGITAVTDATPDLEPGAVDAIAGAMRRGALPQRVTLLGLPLDASAAAPDGPTPGPYKIVLADSGLPELDRLVDRITAAHAAGRAVAVHCVTVAALVLLLAALDRAGARPGDRIEHASVVPADLVPELARRGLIVVTQPGFLAARGDDYLRDVPADEHQDLYRCATLIGAGVPVALSSDAPYGPLDPWQVITAAMRRCTAAGRTVAPAERLPARQALGAYLGSSASPGGPPRRVRVGAEADLVLLDRPLAPALESPDAGTISTVLRGGRVVHSR